MKFVIYSFLIVLVACKATESTVYSNGTAKIRCYTQKEIPGAEGEKIRNYLNCQLEGEQIWWDSVFFNTEKYIINERSGRLRVELNDDKLGVPPFNTLIYYKKENQNFKLMLDKVLPKEDLYLP